MTHHFRFDSDIPIQLDSRFLIFNSVFRIQFYSVFTIWFDSHCMHLARRFQFYSAFTIKLNRLFTIKFESVFQSDLTTTAKISFSIKLIITYLSALWESLTISHSKKKSLSSSSSQRRKYQYISSGGGRGADDPSNTYLYSCNGDEKGKSEGVWDVWYFDWPVTGKPEERWNPWRTTPLQQPLLGTTRALIFSDNWNT